MTTQTHILMSIALFTKKKDPKKYYIAAILAGIFPDAIMFVFYFIEKVIWKTPEVVIWQERYYSETWQFIINAFNSIPLALLVLCIGVYLYKKNADRTLLIVGQGSIVHLVLDFFLHYDDGHAHFFPFSKFIFQSPLSYWDVNHYGFPVSIFESLILLLCAIIIYKKLIRKKTKIIFSVIALILFAVSVMMTYSIYLYSDS